MKRLPMLVQRMQLLQGEAIVSTLTKENSWSTQVQLDPASSVWLTGGKVIEASRAVAEGAAYKILLKLTNYTLSQV